MYSRIGFPGGDESGDLSCLMVYANEYQWAFSQGQDGISVYRAVPPFLRLGYRFCTSPKGTGINAGTTGLAFFGDAKSGNCAAKLKVRDKPNL